MIPPVPENKIIYDIASRVYSNLKSGHTEFIYHRAMEIELRSNNILYESEKRVIITYKDSHNRIYSIGEERIDLFILDDNIIIELKAIAAKPREIEISQIYKYYRELTKVGININRGILINFPQPSANKSSRTNIDFIEIKF